MSHGAGQAITLHASISTCLLQLPHDNMCDTSVHLSISPQISTAIEASESLVLPGYDLWLNQVGASRRRTLPAVSLDLLHRSRISTSSHFS